jgi:hypothetical protein
MPVPANLNYDMWLGSTPEVYYTEMRVHPQVGYDRPGWLRCEQFGAGMITGWGQHHIDSANWGMNTEYSGPLSVEAVAEFPRSGLWNVHGDFMVKAAYPDDVMMYISGGYPNGIRYEGTEGWILFRAAIIRQPLPIRTHRQKTAKRSTPATPGSCNRLSEKRDSPVQKR